MSKEVFILIKFCNERKCYTLLQQLCSIHILSVTGQALLCSVKAGVNFGYYCTNFPTLFMFVALPINNQENGKRHTINN